MARHGSERPIAIGVATRASNIIKPSTRGRAITSTRKVEWLRALAAAEGRGPRRGTLAVGDAAVGVGDLSV